MYCKIYKIINIVNNKVYIGQTWRSFNDRLSGHFNNHSTCRHLKHAIDKYGKDKFKICLLTIAHTQKIADYWEQYFITKYNSIKTGYNIREGGSNGKLSEEHKRKIGESNKISMLGNINGKGGAGKKGKTPWNKGKKGSPSPMKGKPSPCRGRKHTLEAIEKIKAARAKQVFSEEDRRKMSEAHKGKPSFFKGKKHSEESNRKNSEAHKGKIAWNKGKPMSEKTKEKLSNSLKGRISPNKGQKASEEARKKMSLARQGRPPSNKFTQLKEQQIIILYTSGKSKIEISKILDIDRSTVYRILKRNNIQYYFKGKS